MCGLGKLCIRCVIYSFMAMQVMNINESPVFLLLDDNISVKHKRLPVNLYESGETTLLCYCE